MITYPAILGLHSAGAVATIVLALATPLLGYWSRRRAPTPSRKVAVLDGAATLFMLATTFTGFVMATWAGWWPLTWIRTSMCLLALALTLDFVALLRRKSIPIGLRWTLRAVALLVVLALMIAKPT